MSDVYSYSFGFHCYLVKKSHHNDKLNTKATFGFFSRAQRSDSTCVFAKFISYFFTGDFSMTAENISTKLSKQTAYGRE